MDTTFGIQSSGRKKKKESMTAGGLDASRFKVWVALTAILDFVINRPFCGKGPVCPESEEKVNTANQYRVVVCSLLFCFFKIKQQKQNNDDQHPFSPNTQHLLISVLRLTVFWKVN